MEKFLREEVLIVFLTSYNFPLNIPTLYSTSTGIILVITFSNDNLFTIHVETWYNVFE